MNEKLENNVENFENNVAEENYEMTYETNNFEEACEETAESGKLAENLFKAGLVLGGAIIGGAVVKFGKPVKEKIVNVCADAKSKHEAKKVEKQVKKDEKKAAKEAKKKGHIESTATEVTNENK